MTLGIGALIGVIIGCVAVVVILAIVFLARTGPSAAGKKEILDLTHFKEDGTYRAFPVHQAFGTGIWEEATEDGDKVLIREKGTFRKPEHYFFKSDRISLNNRRTGHQLVIQGASVLNEAIGKEVRKLKTELSQEKSDHARTKTRLDYFKKHSDKKVKDEIDRMVENENKLRPFIPKTSR